jgi:hypothetical protein
MDDPSASGLRDMEHTITRVFGTTHQVEERTP